MLLYPTNYTQPQQGQQWGAWGAGDSNVGQAMPDYSQSTVGLNGVAPGWESMYSGGVVSQPYQPPTAAAPAQEMNYSGAFGAGAGGVPQVPQAPQPMQPPSMYPGASAGFNERTGTYGGGFNGAGNQVPIANDPNGGGSMSSNPYMSQQTDFLKQQMGDYLGRNLRGIRSNFVGSGGLGGSRQGIAEGQAIGDSVNSFGGQVANMLSGNYQFDRNLNTNSYATHRGLDLQQEQLGANMLNQSTQMPWTPYTNASNMYSQYTGLGSQDNGTNWGQVLGGAMSGAALAGKMGLWNGS